MAEYFIALTTLPAGFDTDSLARHLVEARLAACVQIVPGVRSVYWWDGKIQQDVEQQFIMKTTRDALDTLWAALRARHPYEVPEFVVLPIEQGSPDYLAWITNTLSR
jgi:periplasmic divalent cation tolerance protein